MIESTAYYKKITRLKIKRDKKKNLRLSKYFRWNDLSNFNEVFLYPNRLFEKDPQLLLLPFVSYNMAYPFEDTVIITKMISNPENEHSLVLYGHNAVLFLEKEFTSITDFERYSRFIQSHINKVINTVELDLDKEPGSLWYNNIHERTISFNNLRNYLESNKILIMKKSTPTCSNGNLVINFIEILC
ncbi:hypothetical protein LCGC14_1401530 [marine sediment metagenome]|uniref:Uncharacterized protein n=1 Tax=marine sediment metagenome TaxID=412755 RepID=A0A0F9MYJ4_9ZZZZ